ncbi:glycoside hydrolase family 47 protein [Crucibulum laeve]|uniref:alpha-1,2-Mannosidase n=1 Tax=Crucibulum laeve TaxID=68775 RepID=A0A5C3LIK6_9AGAR|nr:glycoside hydrolase family 47 protein [Crucibulum laeve]
MKHAYPFDELLGLSGGKSNKFNGWGVTLVDSLDTMWLMGLKQEFLSATQEVANQQFRMRTRSDVAAFFETVIRYLGGLLSAYALSGETVFLSRADELGSHLLPVFNGTASGFPAYAVNFDTGRTSFGWMGMVVLFAEATSCQLEYKYLAKLTGRTEYYEKVENVMTTLYNAKVKDGLFVDKWTGAGTPFGNRVSAGASSDSGYEYLLKQWLQSGDVKARAQYLTSIGGIINNLLWITPKRKLLYVTDMSNGIPSHNLEHLTCFLPGLIALGVHTIDLPANVRERHKWAAEGLAYTCWVSYADQVTGLGPDGIRMIHGEKWVDALTAWEQQGRRGVVPGLGESPPEKDMTKRDYSNQNRIYLLRPETVESIYYMWKTTGDIKWRERGYGIFQAIEQYCKTAYGYTTLSSIDSYPHIQGDNQPSWFLAETLKYFYLLFDDSDLLPIDEWVFNTEAHPLPVFSWNKQEKIAYNITPPS